MSTAEKAPLPPAPQVNVAPWTLSVSTATGPEGVVLTVTNSSTTHPVLYKCLTTTPSRYVVRNRQGVIAIAGSVRVQITLQKGVEITGNEENDLFLVEARSLLPGEAELATAKGAEIGTLLKKYGKAVLFKKQIPCSLVKIDPQQSQNAAATEQAKSAPPTTAAQPTAAGSPNGRPSTASAGIASPIRPGDASPSPARDGRTTTTTSMTVKDGGGGGFSKTIAFVVLMAAVGFGGWSYMESTKATEPASNVLK